MILRPYQHAQFLNTREILKHNDAMISQLPTGGGKTAVGAAIMTSIYEKGNSVWFVVPRNELEDQGSNHLLYHRIPHGRISAKRNESRAYRVHVVSKDTLIRRYEKIKSWPDCIIFDEAHIAILRQKEIVDTGNQARAREGKRPMKVIGFTATPERLDGLGLSRAGGGLYDEIDYGPTISELMAGGYLSGMRYFRPPPPDGIHDLKRRGTEFDADELDELLEKRKIYGEVIGHYEKYGLVRSGASLSLPGEPTVIPAQNFNKGRPALIFTRDVKTAYAMADRFQAAGYKFFCIEGKMPAAERRKLIEAHRRGLIDGLTNCEIATYGLDVPRIEYVAMLRLTESRALNFQMIGRGLRPFEEKNTDGNVTYRKEDVVICDHVDLLGIHGHPLQKIEWNFHGVQKKKRGPREDLESLTVCPVCFLYFEGNVCPNCGNIEAPKPPKKVDEVPVELVEMAKPTPLGERPTEERREYVDRINGAISEYLNDEQDLKINSEAIALLLKIAEELDRKPMWVYWRIVEGKMERAADKLKITIREYKEEYPNPINVPLLHELARIRGYKPGWVRFTMEQLRKKKGVEV